MSPSRAHPRLAVFLAVSAWAVVSLMLTGCSEDPAGTDDCPDGQEYHPIDEVCVETEADDNTEPGSNDGTSDAGDDDADDHAGEPDTGDDCEGMECDQASCDPGDSTTLSGTVTIPSGELPLPDVNVYVPYQGSVEPVTDGASCQRCEDQLSGQPLVHDTTDRHGHFEITDVPATDEVPVVVEVGKWRRQTTVDDVQPCQDHSLDTDTTRLPANSDEGHLPQIAITTGGLDAMECLVRKIGIDDQEFTTDRDDDPDGAVHLFAGEDSPMGYPDATDRFDDSLNDGATFTDAVDWWDDLDNLEDYDIVIHSCEGQDNLAHKSDQARQALQDFTEIGGRVFLSHWHNVWLDEGPPEFQSVANWNEAFIDGTETGYIDDSFPKGEMLEEWMVETGSTPAGEFQIDEARGTVDSIDEEIAQQWVYLDDSGLFGGGERTQYFSFNSPVDVPEQNQCGRVVFSDIHVAAGDDPGDHNPFPTGCTTQGFSDQEKALVFMFFDLSRCIIDDGKKEPDR